MIIIIKYIPRRPESASVWVEVCFHRTRHIDIVSLPGCRGIAPTITQTTNKYLKSHLVQSNLLVLLGSTRASDMPKTINMEPEYGWASTTKPKQYAFMKHSNLATKLVNKTNDYVEVRAKPARVKIPRHVWNAMQWNPDSFVWEVPAPSAPTKNNDIRDYFMKK